MKKAILYKNNTNPESDYEVNSFVKSITDEINNNDRIPKVVRTNGISLESYNHDTRTTFNDTVNSLENLIEEIGNSSFGGKVKFKAHQVQAGIAAAILSNDYLKNIRNSVNLKTIKEACMPIISDGFTSRSPMIVNALEAYSEQENRQKIGYDIIYNMQSASQNEFSESFFPTIVISPDNIGYVVTTRLYTVYDELKRDLTGAFANYNKKNLIRAIADPSILKNDSTKAIPVWRSGSAALFTDVSVIPAYTAVNEGQNILTAPISTKAKQFDFIGLCSTDAILTSGTPDMTDALDPAISLENVYIKFNTIGVGAATDVLKFRVYGLPTSTFVAAPQGSTSQGTYKLMNLNFVSDSLVINPAKTRVDNSALVALGDIVTGTYSLRLKVQLAGNINVETGNLEIIGSKVTVDVIRTAGDVVIALTNSSISHLVGVLATAELIGYDLFAYKSNVNRRQRGQLIDPTNIMQEYNIPYRAPITTIHPVTDTDNGSDTSDLDIAIVTTHIRADNQAVQTLIDIEEQLNEYADVKDVNGNAPELFGIGRHFVNPSHHRVAISMSDIVSNVNTADLNNDISAALVNQIKYYANLMYIESEYGPASQVLNGPSAGIPTVLIGTTPFLAQYIMTSGDLRAIGPNLNFKLVSSFNDNMKTINNDGSITHKIFMTFITESEDRNSRPNPLNFGNYIYSPELTAILPISRNGAISKELAIQPRFLHVVNMPVLTLINITNIEAVTSKFPLSVENHPV